MDFLRNAEHPSRRFEHWTEGASPHCSEWDFQFPGLGLHLKTGTCFHHFRGLAEQSVSGSHQAGVWKHSSFSGSGSPTCQGWGADFIFTRQDILQSGTFLESQHRNQGWQEIKTAAPAKSCCKQCIQSWVVFPMPREWLMCVKKFQCLAVTELWSTPD